MSVDVETVARIARLARLRIEPEKMEPLARELDGILHWIEQLQDVDTEGVAPMTSVVEMTLPLREDAVTDGGIAEDVLANAPEAAHGFFLVPKVVE